MMIMIIIIIITVFQLTPEDMFRISMSNILSLSLSLSLSSLHKLHGSGPVSRIPQVSALLSISLIHSLSLPVLLTFLLAYIIQSTYLQKIPMSQFPSD